MGTKKNRLNINATRYQKRLQSIIAIYRKRVLGNTYQHGDHEYLSEQGEADALYLAKLEYHYCKRYGRDSFNARWYNRAVEAHISHDEIPF